MLLWSALASTGALLFALAAVVQVSGAHRHIVEHIDRQIHHVAGVIRMAVQDAINAIEAQLRKAQGELTGELASLRAQLEAAGVAEQVDLSGLAAVAEALDAIVPDPVPADEPVEPAEPVE